MKTDLLRPHPLNTRIYGKADSDELLESVKRLGVLEPVVFSRMALGSGDAHYYILSGTRRWMAARAAKLNEVPTREIHLVGLEAERFLIEANRYREKNKGQRIREYQKLKEIETALAKEREREAGREGGKSKGRANLPHPSEGTVRANLHTPNAGRAREHAAVQVGLKPRTAEKGLAVLERAESGDPKAARAMESLDRGEISVHRAYVEVLDKPEPPDEETKEAIALAALDEADELLLKAAKAVARYVANREAVEDKEDEQKTLRRMRSRIESLTVQLMEGGYGKAN